MSKFKVGDRIRALDSGGGLLEVGSVYAVTRIHSDGNQPGVVISFCGIDKGGWYYDSHFELVVEPLRFEVGATVVIDGGKDEWEVVRLTFDECKLKRGVYALWTVKLNDLTVVRAKPEPPFRYGDHVTIAGGKDVWRVTGGPMDGRPVEIMFGVVCVNVDPILLSRV